MASTTTTATPLRLFLFVLLTISLSIPSNARPCKSLFLSLTLHRHQALNSADPISDIAIIVDLTDLKSAASSSNPLIQPFRGDILHFNLPRPRAEPVSATAQPHLLHELPYVTSLRDRTKDILSVVVALLFGLGCGALTAASMYLTYSLCFARFGDEDGFSDDNKENFKQMGYVKIGDAAAPVKSVG